MATQRMTVAKIGGAAGAAALRSLNSLPSSLEAPRKSGGCNGGRGGTLRPLRAFLASLRANSSIPPVIFFVEYVDSWSMGDVFQRCLPRRASPNIAPD